MNTKDQTPKLRICLVLMFFSLAFIGFAQTATISEITGRVQVRIPGRTWETAQNNQELPPGTMVSTGVQSTARVRIGESSLVLSPLTRLGLDEIQAQANVDQTRLSISTGRVSAQVRSAPGREATFEIRSPLATASVRGTDFEFDGVRLAVTEGSVALANPRNQSVVVPAGVATQAQERSAAPSPIAVREEQASVVVSTLPPVATPGAPPPPPVIGAPALPPPPPSTTSLRVRVVVNN